MSSILKADKDYRYITIHNQRGYRVHLSAYDPITQEYQALCGTVSESGSVGRYLDTEFWYEMSYERPNKGRMCLNCISRAVDNGVVDIELLYDRHLIINTDTRKVAERPMTVSEYERKKEETE